MGGGCDMEGFRIENFYSLVSGTTTSLQDLCLKASKETGISAAMVDKDAWVVFVLSDGI